MISQRWSAERGPCGRASGLGYIDCVKTVCWTKVQHNFTVNRETGPMLKDQLTGPMLKDQFTGPMLKDQLTGPMLKDQLTGPMLKDQLTGPMLKDQLTG